MQSTIWLSDTRVIISLNAVRVLFFRVRTGSSRYTPKGIFSSASRYCLALVPESSLLFLTSFSFSIAFSFTLSSTFIKQICCSRGILLISKFPSVLVYCIVRLRASLKNCFAFVGRLSKRIFWSYVSTTLPVSVESKSKANMLYTDIQVYVT